MNNKPVAWMDKETNNVIPVRVKNAKPLVFRDYEIPLYTHPVKEQDCYGDGNVYRGVRSKDSEVQTIYFNPVKELTDEEIEDLIYVEFNIWADDDVYESLAVKFARAILRKAQEK